MFVYIPYSEYFEICTPPYMIIMNVKSPAPNSENLVAILEKLLRLKLTEGVHVGCTLISVKPGP